LNCHHFVTPFLSYANHQLTNIRLKNSTCCTFVLLLIILTHSYDALGNRLQTLLPDGRSLNWLYYGSGHLHQINLDGEVLADIERDALHRETSRSQGQLKSQFDYDPAGRLKHHTVRHSASASRTTSRGLAQQSSAVLERAYAYDATGQLVARADSLRGRQDFKYDPVGRILSALPSALPPSLAKFLFLSPI
jgi:YD repeat-containing protein